MKITTKFDVGDIVWAMDAERPKQFPIASVKVTRWSATSGTEEYTMPGTIGGPGRAIAVEHIYTSLDELLSGTLAASEEKLRKDAYYLPTEPTTKLTD